MKNNAVRQYYSKVRRGLVCSGASRKQLLGQGEALMIRFEQENPDAQYADFITAFGPPEVFAGEMLSTVGGKEVEDVKRRRRCAKWIVLAGVALVLIAGSAFWFAKWSKAQEVVRGDFNVINGTSQEITEEDYFKMFERVGKPGEGE